MQLINVWKDGHMDGVDKLNGWTEERREGGKRGEEISWEGNEVKEGGRKEGGKDRAMVGGLLPSFHLTLVSGSTITAEIQGVIDACVKLTGMPDLTLSFMVKSWIRD